MTIEFGHYGFMLDTKYAYIALSWELLIVSAVAFIGYRIWKNRK